MLRRFFLVFVLIASIVGQFPAPGGDEWGALLEKDSSLTGCVSAAIRPSWVTAASSRITEDAWVSVIARFGSSCLSRTSSGGKVRVSTEACQWSRCER